MTKQILRHKGDTLGRWSLRVVKLFRISTQKAY